MTRLMGSATGSRAVRALALLVVLSGLLAGLLVTWPADPAAAGSCSSWNLADEFRFLYINALGVTTDA